MKFLITSQHDVFVDNYNEGEQENVNFYCLDGIIEADNYKEAVTKYLQENLGYNLDINNCEVRDNAIFTSCLVDIENYQPTNNEVEQWKRGQKVLYSNNIEINVSQILPMALI